MPQKSPRIGIISLGCPKNLVDTERLMSALLAFGYRLTDDFTKADAVVINTCAFIGDAQEESFEAIEEALTYDCRVIVTGCLGAKAELIRARFPKVTALTGPGHTAATLNAIKALLTMPPIKLRTGIEPGGVLLTPPHYAYLKIAEGCRHRCSFCIIPQLRGNLRSRRPADILKEAEALKARGVKELLVIAQDSSDYGFGQSDFPSLSKLLRQLSELELWVRVHYVYPSAEADKVVELMGEGLILPYLDVPLQHASPKILKAMRRPGDPERTLSRIALWRQSCPDLAIRSTFITGFPGESEEDFELLMDFIDEAKLDRVGCFPYSPVEGAAANALPDAIDDETREYRAEQLMALQERISEEKLGKRVGSECEVIIDGYDEDGVLTARSKYEAPEVDGVIYLEDSPKLAIGEFVRVLITDHDEHDLWAKPIKP